MADWTLHLIVPSRMENEFKVPVFPSSIVIDEDRNGRLDFEPEQMTYAPDEGVCAIDTEESQSPSLKRWYICGECGMAFSLWYYAKDGDARDDEPYCCPGCGRRVR